MRERKGMTTEEEEEEQQQQQEKDNERRRIRSLFTIKMKFKYLKEFVSLP